MPANIKKLYFKDTSFAHMMQHRIYNVLLIASNYDAFMLEEDGRIEEQLFYEYHALNLRYPPRFTRVATCAEAIEQLSARHYELVMMMPNTDSPELFEQAKEIKNIQPDIPIVALTICSREVSEMMLRGNLSQIDYFFTWLGNADLLLAIVKLVEDSMNVAEDVASVGAQIILLVEDSPRFYSSYLSSLYKFIFTQSRTFMTEALNEHEQMLRMRGRPKVLLARTYEEALSIYNGYSNNILGVISDGEFPKDGVVNQSSGMSLCRYIRERDPYLPLIMQSSETSNRELSKEFGCFFLNKNSKTLDQELRYVITVGLGFGAFVFRDPVTDTPVLAINNLKELQDNIHTIPAASLRYHVSRNDISRWLYSRAMFPLAEFLKQISLDNINNDIDEARRVIFDAIVNYRQIKNKGVVAMFRRDSFDTYSNFARIGNGALGGKGRGLAFLNAALKRHQEQFDFEDTTIAIPRTAVISTELFDEFMETNNLFDIGLSDEDDHVILLAFLEKPLPERLMLDIATFIQTSQAPVAVRSSSLLEDSQYQPFAGVYSTYMVPNDIKDPAHTVDMLASAIKAVYASVYFHNSKTYMAATQNIIDNEKMAVVLQEVVGEIRGTRYYPSFSGVARSLNFYPLGAEQPEDGIVSIALGLGRHIVEGGVSLRFSPKYPHKALQTSTIKLALSETQTTFDAFDLTCRHFMPELNDGFNLVTLDIEAAEADGALQFIASTLDVSNHSLIDHLAKGRKVITFANILKHDIMPLAQILDRVLTIGQQEMGRPIEIEFAVNIDPKRKQHRFFLLQIRPIVDTNLSLQEPIDLIDRQHTVISSPNVLGHGIIDDVFDIVYVKSDGFNAAYNPQIADQIEAVNQRLAAENRCYILVGPGRWGSSDHWLGIPVKWTQIASARVIVECGLDNYRIDPSQGTHFFQNLTSLGAGYFTVNPFIEQGFFDNVYLDAQPAHYETEFIRHIRFNAPLVIKIDGKKGCGVVLKPVDL
ncbi:MAG: phosphoenolpyruvate synthase [Prevotellaceae bacterium]|jgi:CheY-like chemotaxis protein|nr:phosphoenolpyruvate synthase [Prevotellaceae bacterium]